MVPKPREILMRNPDRDVVIALDEVNWAIEKDTYEICFHVGLEHDILVSPILYSRKEMGDELTKITPFFRNIEKEGILL